MEDSGIYTRSQLRALGYSDADIRRAVRAGDLHRLRHGWISSRLHDPTVAMAVRDGGVLACVSALTFHGLWVPPGHDDLHLRRGPNMTGRHPACAPLQGPVRGTDNAVDSVPVALKYAARCLRPDEWIAVCDSYLNRSGTATEDLAVQMGRIGPTVRDLLYRTDARSQSGTESIPRVRLRGLGYEVVVQPHIAGVQWSDLRIGMLILECDSVLHHSSREDYQRDHDRDRRALVDGWMTMRLTYGDILYGWDEVLEDVRAITRARRHRARSVRDRDMVQKSVRSSTSEDY
ncbi:type IV toxin-antitoxin system AbiEi family antitoxin domain-containing protein [Gordonia sp. HY002]|uniref:type IV toxin-antitoxin system AbiEi family antitoxin domain-containing protein n=1 Tax=Gordonia zhenghanii TaxID=2911516 RepID=UPI001EF0EEE6|nr:type IV toxin-antitoxin system AbiEi family antitoxin domain-containing protein [Gordonia zhenghanii]MCF8571993.1 type IV toxin-antitoxin system AbiEi family antitoxin domain-containing protein [Gordonia zhenghanii]MCF8604211.1 type IV toxin-antitoxin system AbiEi family antitoxin domain-containing protein [Gordonia zhenghanii]